MGGPIADKLQNFDSNKTYVTVHESGNDNAIFVADGITGWYRLNPSQFPNGTQVWSPFATATGGAGAVLSIEVTLEFTVCWWAVSERIQLFYSAILQRIKIMAYPILALQ
jgi:hypothetical protein